MDMNQSPSKSESYLIVVLIAIVLGAAMALAAGCQTAGGFFRDMESVGRYGREHIYCEPSQ